MNSCAPTPECRAEALANYVQEATLEDLPNEVVAWAKVLIEDHLGCVLAAWDG